MPRRTRLVEIEISPEVFERASCDAKDLGSLDATAPEARDDHGDAAAARAGVRPRPPLLHGARLPVSAQPRYPPHRPRAQGGGHHLWNITLLCSGHHSALHEALLVMKGQPPYGTQFHWVYGPPLPVGL